FFVRLFLWARERSRNLEIANAQSFHVSCGIFRTSLIQLMATGTVFFIVFLPAFGFGHIKSKNLFGPSWRLKLANPVLERSQLLSLGRGAIALDPSFIIDVGMAKNSEHLADVSRDRAPRIG